ncbi:Type-1 restriction enzyme R protein [Anaerohalosphaera lusitana]|uniref:Type-1 restriction enzyme R protein n=1 Tax=Anaerohalosphaera lusitana TaxID=1936003 RepID=A0A1U9NK91_9BACT|nr:type I restriction-modification enzyme R subunit C-terminal domain-containing protein [Anaerohalosphaera lusitana]AQT68227.1 Type-1 restriction enzyme R protein [Anaerohalosphaera lusitana]
MTPEEWARKLIDEQLKAAGWVIQDRNQLNLGAGIGVAVREFPMTAGPVDYLLFVNRKAAGVIEAKPVGATLGGVDWQSDKYANGVPSQIQYYHNPLPYVYESTGKETLFRNLLDPDARSRNVFSFYRPETIADEIEQADSLRARMQNFPSLIEEGLRDCQVEAITELEKSFAQGRPRALIQMATGAGKSFTAVTFIYRLIKFAKAKRVLFLVDRNNLGRQALKEFQQYVTPDDGRKFTELYDVQHLKSNTIDPISKVCITTIQRLYSMLRGDAEIETDLEEQSAYKVLSPKESPEVVYNPDIPIETFDFIITDECHRSIYNQWRQVLDYFDSFIIGLTATPSKQTLGFFNQNLVTEYPHERAVGDGVNVGYEVYRIKTQITDGGSKVEAGSYIDKRNKLTREMRWEELDDDLEYESTQLDRAVVSEDQIRTVIKTFRDKLFTEIFPGRTDVPKTLVFAKDDSHAEDIVRIIREEFGKGNDFAKKITYRTTGEKPEDLIASFRNSYNPRIAVTVDMISTGTDIKPLECLLFMRSIRSRVYFEQMKGRGTRTITQTDLKAVTSDAKAKTHFVIVDAVGVCEQDKTESRPLERKKSVSFEKLLNKIALGARDEDTITTLAGRLARLNQELSKADKEEISQVSEGKSLPSLINGLLDAVDPDKAIEEAKAVNDTAEPTNEQIEQAAENLANTACEPFDNPDLRNTLVDVKKRNEQYIDTISQDAIISAGFDEAAKERAKGVVDTFKQFIEDNKDEITALQIIYNMPYSKRHVTYEQIEELVRAIEKPPYGLSTDVVWMAYKQLEESRVKNASPQKLLADTICLIRFALGKADVLEPWSDVEQSRFERWLGEQKELGRQFTPEQMEWLTLIKDHVTASLAIEPDDFQYAPFNERGGLMRAYNLFGDDLNKIIQELNEVLAA